MYLRTEVFHRPKTSINVDRIRTENVGVSMHLIEQKKVISLCNGSFVDSTANINHNAPRWIELFYETVRIISSALTGKQKMSPEDEEYNLE